MLHQQKVNPETYEIEPKKKGKKGFALNRFEIFCELCFYKIQQDIEWRQLQFTNHQLMNVNRAHSEGSVKFQTFHKPDKFGFGQLL